MHFPRKSLIVGIALAAGLSLAQSANAGNTRGAIGPMYTPIPGPIYTGPSNAAPTGFQPYGRTATVPAFGNPAPRNGLILPLDRPAPRVQFWVPRQRGGILPLD